MKNLIHSFQNAIKLLSYLPKRIVTFLKWSIVLKVIVSCYAIIVNPIIISYLFQSIEENNISMLLKTVSIGAAVIVLFLILCYIYNVYVDLNVFKIRVNFISSVCGDIHRSQSMRNIESYEDSEIVNIINTSGDAISIIFQFCGSILASIVGIGILIVISGGFSYVLLISAIICCLLAFFASKFLAKKMEKLEGKKQVENTLCEKLLKYIVFKIEYVSMNHISDTVLSQYREQRTKFWHYLKKQEFTNIWVTALQDLVSSLLRGVLGILFFPMYEKGAIKYDKITTSFSVFDQLKGSISGLLYHVSVIGKGFVAINRADKMMCKEKIAVSKPLTYGQKNVVEVENLSVSLDGKNSDRWN